MKKKGKGLSFDQKRDRMLAIFHKTKDVFNYQQVEKMSTNVSIPYPSVKQILNSLKADGLVECQKIGAGVFYWSFPSKAYQIMKQRLEVTEKMIISFTDQNSNLQNQIEQARASRIQNQNRSQLKQSVKQYRQQLKQLDIQVQKYIRFDRQRYQLLVKQNNEIRTALNQEVDNLEQIKKYIKKSQIGIKNNQIQEQYGIPEDLDYEE